MLVTELVDVEGIPHELVDHHCVGKLLFEDVISQIMLGLRLQFQTLNVW